MLDQEEAVSIESYLISLVRAVRNDDAVDERSARDVYVAARRRRRQLGMVSVALGPLAGFANQVADLYCEAAVICDVAALYGRRLADDQIAAHVLVLWGIADDLGAAERSLAGTPSVADLLGAKMKTSLDSHLPEEMTKLSIAKALWSTRAGVGDVRRGATGEALLTVAFTGFRTKKVIRKIEGQLGID